MNQTAQLETVQLFVVDNKDKKSGAVSSVYVFDNHDAALRCRKDLGLGSDHLRGCVVFSDWKDGQPVRKEQPAFIKGAIHEAYESGWP